ncbi:DMT family transporter [Pseudomonas sp. R5(2019)]|uniref:DMT family transporter n=1 Tax=Pseudomonas sp. R5(2019) TaxID=2697566 RepID=UPI0014120D4B|nr:DMT family transporter [Pseudomonas sp. R5(2019)]NBA98090.1 EamA family transporter [Pseudomonas sp. R5(2019)]
MSAAVQSLNEVRRSKETRIGIGLCLLSMFIFATQDGITKILVEDLPVTQLVMVRYWVFLIFAVCFVQMKGGLGNMLKSSHPWLQLARSLLGVFEIVLFGVALRYLGLAETHAIYAVFPLLTMGMAALVLREQLTLRQGLAAVIGFAGTLIILKPGMGVFSLASLIPLAAALMFACFNILTRKISRADTFGTNMLYMGLWGALVSTVIGLPQWVTPSPLEIVLMLVLSITGVLAQLLLLQALKYAEAVTLQPFNYSLLVFASVLGVVWFSETLETTLVVGALLVVLGGMFSLRR